MNQNKKTKNLFEEFPEVPTKLWEEKIIQDLKGADYEKKLVWNPFQGLKFKPYYRQEDIEEFNHIHTLPGEFPYIRGLKKHSNNWEIRQDIDGKSIDEINKLATEAVEKGANAIGINAGFIKSPADLSKVLENIDLKNSSIHFYNASSYPALLLLLEDEFKKLHLNSSAIQGSFNYDPVGFQLLHGATEETKESIFREGINLLNSAATILPSFRIITVNGSHYHNAGANIIQELAYSIAAANEYLAELTDLGMKIDNIASKMMFNFAVGSDYFLEIAKFRAARLLWARVVEQYNPTQVSSAAMKIHAITSLWNKTIYDPYVNILRTTTEIMAASIGGADSISVLPFDSTFKKPDNFSLRLARNQQIVIKEESYLHKVADIAGGSYYIETLTDNIAKETWKLFQHVEEKGGMMQLIKQGEIYDEIEKTCLKRNMDIAMRKTIILGTNQYPEMQETMLNRIEPHKDSKDLSSRLKFYRGASAFEALRLATEDFVLKGNKQPLVFLFCIGNLNMRRARAMFSSNFFGCAGYKVIESPEIKSVEEGVSSALSYNPDIVVLCSSDEEYALIAPDACKLIKKQNQTIKVIVAGFPASITDKLKE